MFKPRRPPLGQSIGGPDVRARYTINMHKVIDGLLTLKVLVATIDALGHFETG